MEEGNGDFGRDWFPIRVVSQRTGVNTVTLRAWERRYGLLRPLRTAKGHRLYSMEDIARVERIVGWLNRGVAISQVPALIDRDGSEELADAGIAWQDYGARVRAAVADFDEQRLDDVLNEALALYPFATVCERLLLPLQQGMVRGGQPGDRAVRAFVEGVLSRKLAARVQLSLRHLQGPSLLLLPLDEEPGTALEMLMLAAACQAQDCPVLLPSLPLPAADILLICERRAPRALVLYGEDAQDPAAFSRLLAQLAAAAGVPVWLAGPVARIHEALAQDCGVGVLADLSPAVVAQQVGGALAEARP